MNKKEKKNKGITLIALVITIIIILILAGVSLRLLLNQNGLLTRTKEAKEENIVADEKENVEIAYSSATIKKLGNSVNENDLQEELNDSVGNGKTEVTVNGDETLNVLFNDTKHNFNVDDGKVEKVKPITNNYGEDWVMAWTCNDGIWSNTIQAGNVVEGDIVAKLYETGNKITPDSFTWNR